jgi:hypothetical protein
MVVTWPAISASKTRSVGPARRGRAHETDAEGVSEPSRPLYHEPPWGLIRRIFLRSELAGNQTAIKGDSNQRLGRYLRPRFGIVANKIG